MFSRSTAVDRVLLAALQRDGRTPNNELARQAGIAPSTCLARVRSLRERGAIRGIHADVDPEVLGLSIQAMIAVSLKRRMRARRSPTSRPRWPRSRTC